MDIQQQIENGAKLLASKGVDQEHIDHYKALIPGLVREVVGKVTTHFPKLLELAGAHEEETEDNAKLVNFSLGCRLDFSDVEVYNAKVKLTYSERVTDTGVAQGPVHGDGVEPELPLEHDEDEDSPTPGEDSPLPEAEKPAAEVPVAG